MTTRDPSARLHGSNHPRRPNDVRRDRALDLDRISSMSDEGGCAGATADLNEQLAHARAAARARQHPKPALIWGGPLAATAAGVLVGMLSRWRPWAA